MGRSPQECQPGPRPWALCPNLQANGRGGHCSLTLFLPGMTTSSPLPFDSAVAGDGRPTSIDSPPSVGDVSVLCWWAANSQQTEIRFLSDTCHETINSKGGYLNTRPIRLYHVEMLSIIVCIN